ncbi:MAG: sugar ABC transporter substrate-binding protein, partial [Acetobacteraceae bacterium]
MQTKIARRTLLTATGAGLIAAAAPFSARAAERKWKIDLSNSFIGNKWRLEMVNLFKAGLQMEPYESTVEGRLFNSGNNVSEESQQITGMIGERVDAI